MPIKNNAMISGWDLCPIRDFARPGLAIVLAGLLCSAAGSLGSDGLRLQEATLGSFFVDRIGSQVRSEFHVSATATNVALGFAVDGLRLDRSEDFEEAKQLFNALASGKLSVRLRLLEKGASNEFYRAEFILGSRGSAANYEASRLSTNHRLLFLFNGIEPLQHGGEDNLLGDATATYWFRENESPVKNRKLIAGSDYVVELTVLKPIEVTNEFKLWMGSIGGRSKGTDSK